MKIKHTHIAVIAGIILLSGCTTYPKNYTYSPTVTMWNDCESDVVLSSPFAKKPQPVPSHRNVPCYSRPQVEYMHYRVPAYPDYPPYRSDSYEMIYNRY